MCVPVIHPSVVSLFSLVPCHLQGKLQDTSLFDRSFALNRLSSFQRMHAAANLFISEQEILCL
jgi:hypothetical protein